MALRTLRAGPRVRRPQLAEGPARDPTCVCGLGERERAGFRLLRILHVHFCERMSVFVKGQVVGGCGGPIKQRSTQKVDGGLRGNNPEDLAEQGAPLFCSNPGSAARIARQPAFTGLNCFSDREPEVRPLELGARGLSGKMVLGCLQDRQMQGFIPEVGDPAMVSFWFLPTSFALRTNKLITAPCSCASIGEPVGFAPSVKCRISFLLEAFKYLGMYVNGDLSTLPLPCSQSLSTVWPARSGKDSTTGSGGHLFVTVFRAYLYIFHLWEYLFKW